MNDKTGMELATGDYVLVGHKDAYLNFGCVLSTPKEPRDGVIVVEAFQAQNDPRAQFQLRVQTCNSPHRLVKIPIELVPEALFIILAGQQEFTETGAKKCPQ